MHSLKKMFFKPLPNWNSFARLPVRVKSSQQKEEVTKK